MKMKETNSTNEHHPDSPAHLSLKLYQEVFILTKCGGEVINFIKLITSCTGIRGVF